MKLSGKLLLKNVSAGRMAAFVISNVMGLLIVMGAIQFYADARGIWEDEEGFMSADYLVVNKQVTGSTLYTPEESEFNETEIEDLQRQPWVRSVGKFRTAAFRVGGALNHNGAGVSTALFLESVPDQYLDVAATEWHYVPGQASIPLIIPKDYLTLYNFGFAASAGMPRLSEQLMEGVPLNLRMRSENGEIIEMPGRVVGFTNRLNTILVPESFLTWANDRLAPGREGNPTRLIIDTNSPGDMAIAEYLKSKGWEQAGGDNRNSAAFLLKVVAGIVAGIGVAIILMSLMILLLSISLLMEKNRRKIGSLLLLGFPLKEVSCPYRMLALFGSTGAWLLSGIGILALRSFYLPALKGLTTVSGLPWLGMASGLALAMVVSGVNILQIANRIKKSWMHS